MWGDGFIADGGGQNELVGDGAGDRDEAWSEAGEARGKPCLWGDGDLGAAGELGVADAFGGVLDGGSGARGRGAEVEPGFFFFDVADELGADVGAGAHEAGADGGDADALGAKLRVEAFRVAGEGELAGGIGEQMRDGHFAADRGDVDDGGAMGAAFEFWLAEERGKSGLGGVERSEEVVLHGGFKGFDGLIFDGADLDDAGAVDQDIEALEMADGELNHLSCRVVVGEISGKEEDVVGIGDIAGGDKRAASCLEIALTARDEDKTSTSAAIDAGELKPKAGGAAGDEDDRPVFAGGTRAGAKAPRRDQSGDGDSNLGGAHAVELLLRGHEDCDAGSDWRRFGEFGEAESWTGKLGGNDTSRCGCCLRCRCVCGFAPSVRMNAEIGSAQKDDRGSGVARSGGGGTLGWRMFEGEGWRHDGRAKGLT